MIPRVAHFVFGLEEQDEPFHFLHYAALESCRRVLAPEAILFHYKHPPWGPWWERIRPHLTLVEVDHVAEVLAADYSTGHVPAAYRYAHHSDFIRLDALIEHGGVYADIDTVFVRPFPSELFDAPFVIGREPDTRDEKTGEWRPSLCNALLMAEPGAPFALAWRERMPAELNSTWSNHSGLFSEQLAGRMPSEVRVEPEVTFLPFPPTRAGLSSLLTDNCEIPGAALSVHLSAHLWWDRQRLDFSRAHDGWCGPPFVRHARTTLAELLRPYLPDPPAEARSRDRAAARSGASSPRATTGSWSYLSIDEDSGYGVAADRCIAALEDSGLRIDWVPFVGGAGWDLAYEPLSSVGRVGSEVVISHLVAEYLPGVRRRNPEAFVVGHTVWDTDRIPEHWRPCLDEADLVVVPSQFSAAAVAASKVATPVVVVPHVAPLIGSRRSTALPGIASDVLVFYTIGEWNERKAVFKTIEAYLCAFTGRDRVLLVVKTSHQDRRVPAPSRPTVAGPGTSAAAVAALVGKHRDPPRVRLITGSLTRAEIASLHRRGDCFVSLCRAEGWGLGAFDAAANGNPVVTTGFGGQLDYLGGSPYLVDYDLIPVQDPIGFPSYAPDQRWAEPDLDHAVDLLREVAAAPGQAAAVADRLGENIRRRYRPAAVAAAFRAAVERHLRGATQPGVADNATVRR